MCVEYAAIIADIDSGACSDYLFEALAHPDPESIGDRLPQNCFFDHFMLDEECDDMAEAIGWGLFFKNGWSKDNSVSWIGPVSELDKFREMQAKRLALFKRSC